MPKNYENTVNRLFSYCENSPELRRLPWLINTMGFTNGIGEKVNMRICRFNEIRFNNKNLLYIGYFSLLPRHNFYVQLMSKTLSVCRPTTVVELRSRFEKKNYRKKYLKNYVESLKSADSKGCDFLQFNAIPESLGAKDMRSKDLWGIPEPKKLRDISILAYFGQCCPKSGKET